jgi:hypothetical protein
MVGWLVAPMLLQGLLMIVDEAVFHRRRGLPRWERLGHPLDTLTVAVTLGFACVVDARAAWALPAYVALAAFSSLFVTKDEPVHAKLCGAGEQWLHAMLFVLHPVVFFCYALLWRDGGYRALMIGQLLLTVGFGLYQWVYWSVIWRPRRA